MATMLIMAVLFANWAKTDTTTYSWVVDLCCAGACIVMVLVSLVLDLRRYRKPREKK
jgi:hypothetical protein